MLFNILHDIKMEKKHIIPISNELKKDEHKYQNKLYIYKLLYTWKYTQLLFTILQFVIPPGSLKNYFPAWLPINRHLWLEAARLSDSYQAETLSTFSPLTKLNVCSSSAAPHPAVEHTLHKVDSVQPSGFIPLR